MGKDTRSASLRYHLNINELRIEDAARYLDIRRETMTAKLQNPDKFTVDQMNNLTVLLKLNQDGIIDCFFNIKVT